MCTTLICVLYLQLQVKVINITSVFVDSNSHMQSMVKEEVVNHPLLLRCSVSLLINMVNLWMGGKNKP